jgi:hypothetical protein
MDFGDSFSADAESAHLPETSRSVEMFDTDSDGYDETRVSYTDAGMTVAVDRDRDGVIDTFTSVGSGGHYESWEIFRASNGSARWDRTSAGDVFE